MPELQTLEMDVEMPETHAAWWREKGRYPVTVVRRDRFITVAGSRFSVVRNTGGGYYCYRLHPRFVVLGEIYEYGVRKAVTADIHMELSAARVALFPGTTFPSPLCYEMRSGALIHPGPCFDRSTELVKTTRYQLTGAVEAVCAVCKERIQ